MPCQQLPQRMTHTTGLKAPLPHLTPFARGVKGPLPPSIGGNGTFTPLPDRPATAIATDTRVRGQAEYILREWCDFRER
jgi:hypothetical protein